jgi:transketolase
MRNAFLAALLDAADANRNIWLLCGDLGYSVLEPFRERFPDRYCNVGVAEQNMAGIAAGLAHSGKTVFIYSIGNFPTFRCLEQLRNDVCYHGADVKVVAVGAGFAYGSQGYSHHALEDVAVMGALPNIEIFSPCDPRQAHLATHAISTSGRPAYLRLSRAGEPNLTSEDATNPRTPALLIDGSDVMILATGPIAWQCRQAVGILGENGISAALTVIGCLQPFASDLVRQIASRHQLLVTVEEHVLYGGLHMRVAASLAVQPTHAPVLGIGIADRGSSPSLSGSREALLQAAGLSGAAIARRIAEYIRSRAPQMAPRPPTDV